MKKLNSKANLVWHKLSYIKQKICNFDIRPAKPQLAEILQQIDQVMNAQDYETAQNLARNLVTKHPTNLSALKKLIYVYSIIGNFFEAKKVAQYALKLYPDDKDLLIQLSSLYIKTRTVRNRYKLLKKLAHVCPDNTEFHTYAAFVGHNLSRASSKYVEQLFDSYAETFDTHLVQTLEYRSPNILANYLEAHLDQNHLSTVLDLGCGTGLFGSELQQKIKIDNLVGIDLSQNMLKQASDKQVYNNLHQQDFIEYLSQTQEPVDLIVSTDAFVYVGDLQAIFEHSHRILRDGGALAFTVEKRWWDHHYKLTTTGRYQHSLKYLKSLYKRYLFSKMYSQTIDLRKESGKMVAGYLVLLQK